jgi:hypothetical protein
MLNYEKVILEMVKKCADCGSHDAQKMANAGIFEPLYLYFKPSSETENGVLKLIPDSETAPDGFELATGEGLRGNVPFSEYFSWVRARVNRLPILAYGVAA